MKIFKFCLLNFVFLIFFNHVKGQTLTQFNGVFTIQQVTFLGTGSYQIRGLFTDESNTFTASNAIVGDRIIDPSGGMYEITSLSVNGSEINAITKDLSNKSPILGSGLIYRSSSKGFPLVAINAGEGVRTTALNTATLSIDKSIPKYTSGIGVPTVNNKQGDVILNTSDNILYKLGADGWSAISNVPFQFSFPSNATIGDVLYYAYDDNYYTFDGSSWVFPNKLSSLPQMPGFGDVFYDTGEKKLYMFSADGKWTNISSSSIPGGTNSDLPTSPKPGDLFFNTDKNMLYVYDTSNNWVEVSINGSTPSGIVNPDASSFTIREGSLFYNTSEHKLYVYNGTVWVPLENSLSFGQIFVGNSSNVAVSVPLSGDATITNTGKITVKNQAITDSKLDKPNIPLSGFGNPIDNISMGDGTSNFKIVNLANPSAGSDATTKSYVDALFTNPTLLTLPNGSFFVGNASNKASAIAKNLIPLSGFDRAYANVSMGTGVAGSNFKIVNLADPTASQDAATKNYVDNRIINPANLTLPTGQFLVGNAVSVATATAKSTISLSGFGAPIADISFAGFKLTNLADPSVQQDAATKNYVDSKTINPTSINLTTDHLLTGDASGKAIAIARNLIPLNSFGPVTADISLSNFKITNLAGPLTDNDASTKKYVDDLFSSPGSVLALPSGNFFIGNSSGKATAVTKTMIPLSGFGKATDNIKLGDATTQYNINFLADPMYPQDAATKNYVDTKISVPSSITIPFGSILIGNSSNQAEAVAKNSVPVSDFGSATSDLSLGDGSNNHKVTNLADPSDAQDAATKSYVDSKSGSIQTGTNPPTNPTVGSTYYNTTEKTFYVYNGTNWVPVDNTLANGKLYVGDASNKAVATDKSTISLSDFGTVTKDLPLANFKITGLGTPSADQDATNKKYVDDKVSGVSGLLSLPTGNMLVGDASGKAASVPKSTISLSGFGDAAANVSMGTGSNNYKIINVADPTGDQDAATKKYVDGKTGGVQTGTNPPTNPTIGTTYYNTTEKTFYVYDGTKWVPVDNTLANGKLYVGDASNKAVATDKSTISISDFGTVTKDLPLANFKITGLGTPSVDQDAANKKYVDDKLSNIDNLLALPTGNMLVGDASGKAASVPKSTISLSGFGDAAANVSMGTGSNNYKIINVADPTGDQDAATKKYVDGKTGGVQTGTNPPTNPTVGATYYNTTEKTFYVYDGTKWVPVDNTLANGQLYVGDATNKAVSTPKASIPLSGFGTPETDIALGSHKITGLADPTADQEAATKKYVDGKTGGVQTGTNPPTDPTIGTTYYNTTEKTFYVYDGTNWVPVDNTLANGKLYVGDASNKAVATDKSTISISDFGTVTKDLPLANFKITGLGTPSVDQDAANKKYVDDRLSNIDNLLALPTGNMLVGDASGKAASVPKSVISLSGFGDAAANVSMGTGSNNYKIINLASPAGDLDAANKKYVDDAVNLVKSQPINANTILGNNTPSSAAAQALSPDQVKAMLALNNVNNTADATKNVYSATKLTTPININGVPFDGSGNITIPGDNLGNHTATQNIKTLTYSISSDGQDNRGLSFESTGSAVFAQDVTVKGNLYTPSDQRLKTHIETLTNVLQAIDGLRGVSFEYKDQKKYVKGPKIGVIAQELQKVYPNMVIRGSDGFLKVDYTQLTAVLIQAVKEQQQKMIQQQRQIDEMKVRLDQQQQQIDSILKRIQ